ncbi:unnamed protein product [Rangifer tarandus platyrhynchus]|uniref:Uncharacterized protein n=1 Tax=Rangifer tarandus platyrhynchus TaxID=3082113 RepID=A0AC59ZGG6_RANTA
MCCQPLCPHLPPQLQVLICFIALQILWMFFKIKTSMILPCAQLLSHFSINTAKQHQGNMTTFLSLQVSNVISFLVFIPADYMRCHKLISKDYCQKDYNEIIALGHKETNDIHKNSMKLAV